tara:strand:- start:2419 stop:3585 length:1167 start_codon:yes stop_codon:yes gene_type:complete
MSEEISQPQVINETVETAPEAVSDAEALSFDDLDNLTDGRSASEIMSEVKAENKKESEKNKSEPEVKSSGEEVKAESEESEASEEQIEEIKKLVAKYGEEELEIAANAIFKHKVNGEEVDVELQELLNNYSGKISYDKKFQEFSEQRKKFDEFRGKYDGDIKDIYAVLNGFKDKMQNKDPLGALDYFANFAGMKPYEFREGLVRAVAPEVARMSQLSSEQLQNERLQAENSYLSQQRESENAKFQEEHAVEELQLEINQIQEAHSISDEDFATAYSELLESEYEGEINPSVVAEYYTHASAFSKAEEVLNVIGSNLVDNDEIVESLQKVIVENPSFDNDDLVEIVQEVYGSFKKEASKSVSKKVGQPSAQKKQTNAQPKQNYTDWDDL